MADTLQIIHYPDPRLQRKSKPVKDFGPDLERLGRQMLDLMRVSQGVGLAAPQVGVLERMFVCNPTGQPQDDLVLVNPELHDLEGVAVAEEGCLSIPDVKVHVRRARRCRVVACDPHGRPVEFVATDLLARICQHETDHLNGRLILDYMDEASRIGNRRLLRQLEDAYARAHK